MILLFSKIDLQTHDSDEELELIGTAEDAYKEVEIIERVIPDVITLILKCLEWMGLTFLSKLMKQHPILL
jgi:two-component system chemotaxis response regulator CheB